MSYTNEITAFLLPRYHVINQDTKQVLLLTSQSIAQNALKLFRGLNQNYGGSNSLK